MTNKLSPRATTALAVAILALVVALSSSATAALIITGAQIKNGSVTGKDVKNKSITGKDIKKKTIAGKHLKKSSIESRHIADGTITMSDVSSTLVAALDGGAEGFLVVTAKSTPVVAGNAIVSAACPSGKVAISANAYWLNQSNVSSGQVRRNGPGGFTAQGSNPFVVSDSLQIEVTCVTAS